MASEVAMWNEKQGGIMKRLILITIIGLTTSGSLSAVDRFGVFADGKSRTSSQEHAAWNVLLDALRGASTPCRSQLRFSQEDARWRISAGPDRAWFWIDALRVAFAAAPISDLRQLASPLQELQTSLSREINHKDRAGVVRMRELAKCP